MRVIRIVESRKIYVGASSLSRRNSKRFLGDEKRHKEGTNNGGFCAKKEGRGIDFRILIVREGP